MASQSPFFGKREREPEGFNSRSAPLVGGGGSGGIGNPPSAAPQTMPLGAAPLTPPAGAVGTAASATPSKEATSKLTVGPNIKLKGVEITDCDTLVVEGTVEATISSRLMQIAERGEYRGAAEIEIAEIRGAFDGNLTVREKLVIHSTGKVTGKIRLWQDRGRRGRPVVGRSGPGDGQRQRRRLALSPARLSVPSSRGTPTFCISRRHRRRDAAVRAVPTPQPVPSPWRR